MGKHKRQKNILMNLKNKRLFIYDFETNGLWYPLNQPIQIAIKIVYRGKTTTYNRYINCTRPLSSTITKLTGITDELLREKGIPIERVFKDINKLIHKKNTLVIGHNILHFDNLFLNYYLGYFNYKQIKNNQCFDTQAHLKAELLGLSKRHNESMGEFHNRILFNRASGLKYKLTDACTKYNIKIPKKYLKLNKGFHNAEVDTEVTYRIFKKQIKELK